MSVQHRIDDRHVATANRAADAARRDLEAVAARLAKVRSGSGDPAAVLECWRELRVAHQRHIEASDEVAAAYRSLRGR
ncbi:MAG: hypothetical protein M3Z29_10015 [Pseudomonadota bacterium]|nr:hypothetical protein [Pseudomonadota bacterium]